jgi:carboxyl-terminal processing protease
VDETAEGNPYAVLRMREVDLDKHLSNSQNKDEAAKDKEREKARDEAIKRLEDESKKPAAEQRKTPEYGSNDDFQLQQALKRLKGQPVLASKTQTERSAPAKAE